ncbi:MAG TPA: hypothetical protein VN039_01655, partial [Nitrospira sp.]|nr:hypothetical protein [Nitrospira sp.]
SLDRKRSQLWMAQAHQITVYDRSGNAVLTLPFQGSKDNNQKTLNIRGLAYDRKQDSIWVNFADRLRRYDSGGCPRFCVNGYQAGNCRAYRSEDDDRREEESDARTAGQPAGRLQEA